jgi:hypothetical protein
VPAILPAGESGEDAIAIAACQALTVAITHHNVLYRRGSNMGEPPGDVDARLPCLANQSDQKASKLGATPNVGAITNETRAVGAVFI